MKSLLTILLLLSSFTALSQYGNEWIDYSQSYYSFQIVSDGVYRIEESTMSSVGIPTSSIPASDYQVFGKEQEIPIRVVDGGDGFLDPGDYIEFHAQGNDGWLDSLIYPEPSDLTNPGYSLYNDTIMYYLSWSSNGGKRIYDYSNTNFGSYTAVPYFLETASQTYSNTYQHGPKYFGASSSYFEPGEGWFSQNKNAASSGGGTYLNTNLSTPNVYIGAGAPDASLLAISASNNSADTINLGTSYNHHLYLQRQDGAVYNTLVDTVFFGYQLNKLTSSFASSLLTSGTTIIRHQLVNDLGVASDYQAVSYVELKFPQSPALGSSTLIDFEVPFNSSENHSLYNFSGFGGSSPHMFVYGDSARHIVPTNNGTYDALVPNSSLGQSQFVVLFDETVAQSISVLNPVNGTGLFTDYLSMASDSIFLIVSAESLLAEANDYATYRQSIQGGSFQTLVMNANELFHQYGGGIGKHALGIKRAIENLYDNASSPPAYVFIIGKSILESTEGSDPGSRKNAQYFQQNLVPTMGYPPSDNMFTIGFSNDTSYIPHIPIGRLAAQTSSDVTNYLSKMQEFEQAQQDPIYTLANKEWMKKVLHFSGGSNATEQGLFQNFMLNFASIIEDTLFGADTYLYAKTSSQPIDLVEFQEIQDHLAGGVSVMNFFGHATPTGFDQNIEEPANWNNQGKYPLLIGNSCYTGNIHGPSGGSVSEQFVLEPNRGTIGFMATSKLGFAGNLQVFCTELYHQISSVNYRNSIGIQQKSAIDSVYAIYGNSGAGKFYEMTVIQMALHGDPALNLNHHERPEFVLDAQRVYFEPETIDLTVDSLDLNIIITNIGSATEQAFNLEVTRHFPVNNTDTTYVIQVNGSYYKDTITLRMPLQSNIAFGLNQFDIRVDLPNTIDEVYDDVSNNQLTVYLPVEFDGIIPVWPYKYAIIPSDTVALKASTVNPLAAAKNYIFEIDTIDFEGTPSPFKKQLYVNSIGGVVEGEYHEWVNATTGQADTLILADSTVYFWRVALDSTLQIWQESSFQYIPGKTGWGQSHFLQFKNDDFSLIDFNRSAREFQYGDRFRLMDCQVVGNANTPWGYANTYWRLDNSTEDGESNLCGVTPTIYVAVVNPFDLQAWENNSDGSNPDFDFGDKNANNGGGCRPWRTEGYFVFPQNSPTYLAALDSMLNNEIPDGYYVLVYTGRYAHYGWWDVHYPNLYQVFQNFGSTQIDTGKANMPFILSWQQGNPTSFTEVYANNLTDTLYWSDTIYAPDYLGNIYSELAGPAHQWTSLHWEQSALEAAGNDSTRIRLVGVNNQGQESTVLDTIFTAQDSIINLNGILDANTYPKARIEAFLQDSLTFTPAQIDRWQLIYEPVGEVAVNPKKGFYFSALTDTIQEGENLTFAMALENISKYQMDSVLVSYWLQDNQGTKTYITYPRQAPMAPGDIILDTVSINSEGYGGRNSFWMEANPYISTYFQDQPEQHYFNNLVNVPFNADIDITNPILDVTFDGLHILDGDIVSGKPEIVMSLDDENTLLLLDEDTDTSNFTVWLTDPSGNFSRIYFTDGTGNEVLRWIPANGSDNVFRIEWTAEFSQDGVYELYVQATDESSNKSGDLDYRISFEVINQSTITEVLNYPNPFSTRTQFVFTLTGNRIPDDMIIQIMTITGRVVREVRMDELGPIRIGRNRTEFWWDGTDMFGDPLANGVYIYRVFTRLDGEEIEMNHTSADRFFKKGYGKMYLMR